MLRSDRAGRSSPRSWIPPATLGRWYATSHEGAYSKRVWHMATIRIAIDTGAEHSDGVLHYEFTWTGNEREARAVINHVEAATVGHGLKPGNVSRGTHQRLNEILANIVDPSEDDKAALLSYAFRLAVIENPSRADHGRTVLQRLALGKGSIISIRVQRDGVAQVIARPLAGDDVVPFLRGKGKTGRNS
jgi:hypothetical protein